MNFLTYLTSFVQLFNSHPAIFNSVINRPVQKALQELRPTIDQVRTTLGVPGLAIGVIHEGSVVYEDYYGYRDVGAQLAPDRNTIFYVASLTKAMTSAAIGILVDEGALNWSTPLLRVLPELAEDPEAAIENLSVIDLLSHRSGRARSDGIYLESHNNLLLSKDDSFSTWNYLPKVSTVRSRYIYNNFAYNLVGATIERLSNNPYGVFMREKLFHPLNMFQTFTSRPPENLSNDLIKAYATLSDGSPLEIHPPRISDTTIMFAGGSVRSTLPDLLQFYGSYLQAIKDQMLISCESDSAGEWKNGRESERENERDAEREYQRTFLPAPFKELTTILQPHITRGVDSVREATYAAGWLRTQLPAKISGFSSDPLLASHMPVVGRNVASRLLLSHAGNMPGCTATVSILPETSSAVVVLANSMGIGDTTGGVSELLIETILGGKPAVDYAKLASTVASVKRDSMVRVENTLQEKRVLGTSPRPLREYTGRYFNAIRNFHITVELEDSETLRFAFQGLESERYLLRHYNFDAFVWNCDYDEIARRAQYCRDSQFYVFAFEDGEGADKDQASRCIRKLRWRHDESVVGGEIFEKEVEVNDFLNQG